LPKIVDHDARRQQVTAAAAAVIARDGLDGATMRAVATEAGCTTGLVTHYFAGRSELLIAVLQQVQGAAGDRIGAHLRGVARPGDALTAVVMEALPLDQARRDEWAVWIAFWGAAVGSPDLRDEHRRRYHDWRGLVRRLVVDAAAHGTVRPGLDLRSEADRLVALIDGLGLQAMLEPEVVGPRRMRALARAHLASLA